MTSASQVVVLQAYRYYKVIVDAVCFDATTKHCLCDADVHIRVHVASFTSQELAGLHLHMVSSDFISKELIQLALTQTNRIMISFMTYVMINLQIDH